MLVIKVYVVSRNDGTIIAVKLTRSSAQKVAKDNAPARITLCQADKK